MDITFNGDSITTEATRVDVIETKGAKILDNITSLNKDYPVITSNNYEKGRAIYIGVAANVAVLNPLFEELINDLSIKKSPDVPDGVMARFIDDKHILYLNTTNEPKEIILKGKLKSLLFDKNYTDSFLIPANEPELIELQ